MEGRWLKKCRTHGHTHGRTDTKMILYSVQCYALLWTDNNNNSHKHNNVYGAVIVAVNCHCRSTFGSFDQSSTSARRLSTFGPDRSPSISDPPVGSYNYYANHCHLLLLSPKADTYFAIPRRVEG